MKALTTQDRAIQKLYEEVEAEATRVTAKAHRLGSLLLKARAKCEHGKWIPYLEMLGIPRTNAFRWMELAEGSKANVKQLGYVGSQPGGRGDSNEWFTPAPIIESVRATLGEIDFDPFSSTVANKTVKAKRFLTVDDDALEKATWASPRRQGQETVFMNPPYSGDVVTKAAERFCKEWDAGSFNAGIVLVNNATDTAWAGELWDRASAIAFTRKRISFVDVAGKNISGNTRGQMFFYFGGNVARFSEVFRESCRIVMPERVAMQRKAA